MISRHSFPAERRRAFVSRPLIAIIALVFIIGGIAWVVQYLPSFNKPKKDDDRQFSDKPLLEFTPRSAVWKDQVADPEKKEEKKGLEGYKIIEQGDKGHYDFLFKNISGKDVEILHYESRLRLRQHECVRLRAGRVRSASQVVDSRSGQGVALREGAELA